MTEWRILPDPASVAQAATVETFAAVEEGVTAGHPARIAVSGGHTPAIMYKLWSGEFQSRFPWAQMELYWGDERYVPPQDPLSNFRMVRESLLDRLSVPVRTFPMPTLGKSPDADAAAYEQTLRRNLPAEGPSFDVVFLGIGEEGHTASLFPGSSALKETSRWVLPVEVAATPRTRLTLTLPVIRRAHRVFFLVTGAEKKQIIHSIRTNPDANRLYPAAMVQSAGHVIWFLDRGAGASS